jgi:ArsR family transcriptional regulator, arsenate/arsenite/antimonite-responsive transcriptional repressor
MDDQQLVRIAKALGDGTRLGILRTVSRRGELCCGEVARAFDVTQATVSHHLKVLADARLIENRREGQFIRLKAVRKTLDEFRKALGNGFDAS